LVDQDDRHIRRTVRGVPVIGRLEDLSKVLPTQPTCPEELILTSDEVPQWSLKKIISEIEPLGLKVVRLPFMRTLQLHQGITACPIAVEELLGRSPQVLNVSIVEEVLRGRSVLVTGAGGSIGSELVRQLIAYAPKRLLLLDSSEYLLYRIDKEIVESLDAKTEKIPCIGDVRDAPHLYTLFETYRPDVVFHAAALKHVPLVEKNPAEGVLTNVMGTRCIADACHTYGTSLMVQISTDKAVAPKSVMGATKRLAELYCQTLDITSATRFVTVRFGNVLGSSGSVVPLFEEQIAQGGPVTVTHAEMVRYFMTVPEAVRLILLSAAAGRQKSDVGGQIFVLEMGAPVRIIDLAHQMIRLKGLTPGKDIKIIYTGVREGEKLYENLFDEQESPAPSGFHGIHLASSHPVRADVLYPLLDELVALAQNRSDPEVAARVREIIAILRS
jgi:O-antigen biosynthesis protein WbqV